MTIVPVEVLDPDDPKELGATWPKLTVLTKTTPVP